MERVGKALARRPGILVGRLAAAPAVGLPTAVAEQRVLKGRRDRRIPANARVETGAAGDDHHRPDRAQVGDDLRAGRCDDLAHLRRRRAGGEPDHGDAEGIAGG